MQIYITSIHSINKWANIYVLIINYFITSSKLKHNETILKENSFSSHCKTLMDDLEKTGVRQQLHPKNHKWSLAARHLTELSGL